MLSSHLLASQICLGFTESLCILAPGHCILTEFCFQTGRHFGKKSAFRHGSCREAIIRWIQQEVSFNLLVFSDPGSRISRISRDESDLEKITGFLMIPKFRIACTHIYNYIYIFMIRLELKIIKAIENPVLSWFKFHFQCWFSWQPCVSQSAAQSQKCWASALLALTWRLNLAMQQLMMPTSPTRIGINKQNLKLTWD